MSDAAMNETVTLSINGREVTVPKGTKVLEAARAIGIEIPHFCYHPALDLVGSCRMCQVEFVAGKRRFLGISCRTDAAEGMEVLTHSEAAVRARAGVLEFLLANHPLDCPICDKAGECPLQDYTYAHGFTESRFKEERRKGIKKTPLGGHIVFDSERCILCTRCVRFMAEYARAPQLTVAGRGDRSVIATFPRRPLDSEYTGNLADICPVGALTLEEFRFMSRVWNLRSTPSICPYCSRGCNIALQVRVGQNTILRVLPRTNRDVHGEFICNTGRFRPLELAGEKRLLDHRLEGTPASREAVLEAAAEGLFEHKDRLLVLTSAQRPLEELYLSKRIFEAIPGVRIVALEPEREKPDGILRTGDLAANLDGLDVLDIPLVTTEDLEELLAGQEITALFVAEPAIKISSELGRNLRFIVYLGHVANETAAMAHAAVPGRTWTEKEGSFINFQGRLQKFLPAVLPPSPEVPSDIESLLALGRLLEEKGAPSSGTGDIAPEAPSVFEAMAERTRIFAGLSFGDIGPRGIMLPDEVNGVEEEKEEGGEP